MKVTINGTEYRLAFEHLHPAVIHDTETDKTTIIPLRLSTPDVKARAARRIVKARISTRAIDSEQPLVYRTIVVAEGVSACSMSDHSNSPEFGRQLALARALAKLPRVVAAPLLGAYLASAPRELMNLGTCSVRPYWQKPHPEARVEWKTVRDALGPAASQRVR